MNSIDLLNGLKKDVAAIIRQTETYLHLPDDVLNARPSAESWSILECFEHLNRYNRFYNAAIDARLRLEKNEISQNVKSTWLGRKSIESMHPSNLKKQKTLKHLNPVSSSLLRGVIGEFVEHQKQLLRLLEVAKRSDLNRIKIPIEFFRLLKMTLGEAFQFVIVHEQRHFLQLERISKVVVKNSVALQE